MPRGVPKKGYRMTAKRKAAIASGVSFKAKDFEVEEQISNETDQQIWDKLIERFDIMETMTDAAIKGDARSLIISGPPGLGKSFGVEKALNAWDPFEKKYSVVKGYVKATGLYKLLYQHRRANQVIVFDDCDAVFGDDVTLNMLKAVCDTTKRRRVSYLSEYKMVDEDSSDVIPNSFDFEGTIIFITNLDFDALIERGHKIAPHLNALISRSHYIDLAMKSKRDYLIRIKQVVSQGMLDDLGLTKKQSTQVMNFIDQNQDGLRELSLRMAIKIGNLCKSSNKWEKVARVTCCRNK